MEILCSKDDIRVSKSHHDAILSKVPLNFMESSPEPIAENVPTVENNRHKISWSAETLLDYQELIQPVLLDLQETWLESDSPSSISLLLQQTNTILTAAAKATQKVIYLNKKTKVRKPPIPNDLKEASNLQCKAHSDLKKVLSNTSSSCEEIESAKIHFSQSRSVLQNTKRRAAVFNEIEMADRLDTILTSNPNSLFKSIKSNKRDSVAINKLHVGDDVFTGNNVSRGFFKSNSNLKSRNHDQLDNCKTFQQFLSDHSNILEI